MRKIKHLLMTCTFLLGTLGHFLVAQGGFELQATFTTESGTLKAKAKEFLTSYGDSLSTEIALNNLIRSLRSSAYLISEKVSAVWVGKKLQAMIDPGPQFKWAAVKNGNIDAFFLDRANINLNRLNGKPISPLEFVQLEEQLLNTAENNGYPFAKVFLDSLSLSDEELSGILKLEKGPAITFDAINIIGEVKVSKQYLQQYLGLGIGDVYSLEKVKAIGARIQEILFLQSIKNSTVTFRNNKAIVNLFLKPKKSSRTDVIVGLLPRENGLNPDVPNKPLITGSLLFDWYNRLGIGERIYLEIERLQLDRWELKTSFTYPYAFGTPFGIGGEFAIYRRDSAYTEVIGEAGIQYLFEGNNYIKAFWENRSASLQIIDTTSILNSKMLPRQLDYNNPIFGVEWNLQKLNYRFNPRKGWTSKIRTGFGNKKVRENNDILGLAREGFDPQQEYDSLNVNAWQLRLDGLVESYFPFGQIFTLKTAVQGGAIFSPAHLLQNEQFRLGGNKLLRGFDEEFFNADRYAVATAELRLLLSTNSFLYVFSDVGYIEDLSRSTPLYDLPVGLGAGISFDVNIGILGFSLALGSQREVPLGSNKVKVHFGFVSLF